MKKKFTVEIGDNQWPVVTFEGDYITKKELDLCQRALRKEQRKIIKAYRTRKIIAEHEAKKGKVSNGKANSDTTKQSTGAQSKDAGTTNAGKAAEGATGASKPSSGTAEKGNVRSNGSNPSVANGPAGKVPSAGGSK